jgi:hypothetical protein
MKFLILIHIVYACLVMGCATKSVFPIGNLQNKDQVFQYCGGQEWGYQTKLNAEKNSPYLAVYLESDISEKGDVIIFNFALQVKSNIEFSLPSKGLKIYIDNQEAYNKPIHFGVVRTEKQIWERYPGPYVYKKIESTENEWEVRKQKYNGFFGRLALEEPFVVKIAGHPFEEINAPSVRLSYDNVTDAIYILAKVIVPFGNPRSKTSEISVHVPAFALDGITNPESDYAFRYDREQLITSMKGAYRCASLEEIFRAGRNRDSWIWWMYPRVSD